MEWINETTDGVEVRIRAVPRASKNEIQGLYDDALKIRLTTAPVDGKANQALIRFLSKALGVSKAQIQITQGETSRHKMVKITGISKEEVIRRIGVMECWSMGVWECHHTRNPRPPYSTTPIPPKIL